MTGSLPHGLPRMCAARFEPVHFRHADVEEDARPDGTPSPRRRRPCRRASRGLRCPSTRAEAPCSSRDRRCRRRRGCAASCAKAPRRATSADVELPAAASADASTSTGRRTTNSLPVARPSLFTSTLPPCFSTNRLTSVSPTPSPPCGRSDAAPELPERLEDGRQRLLRDAHSGIADAEDDLARLRASASSEICPPSSVYFAALLSRLASTWASRAKSPLTRTGSAGGSNGQRMAAGIDRRAARSRRRRR